jgi:hypothetical protein
VDGSIGGERKRYIWLKVRKRSALACMSLRFASLLSNILPPQRHFASKRTPSQQQVSSLFTLS